MMKDSDLQLQKWGEVRSQRKSLGQLKTKTNVPSYPFICSLILSLILKLNIRCVQVINEVLEIKIKRKKSDYDNALKLLITVKYKTNKWTIIIHCDKCYGRDMASVLWRYVGVCNLDIGFQGQIELPPPRNSAVCEKQVSLKA